MFATNNFFFFRKPAGVASTRGKEQCFLDLLEKDLLGKRWCREDFPHMVDQFEHISAIQKLESYNQAQAREQLLALFSPKEEYGLLNRLDTATSGLLYFGSFSWFLYAVSWFTASEQNTKTVSCWSLGEVGRNRAKLQMANNSFVELQGDDFLLRFPMMHHRHDAERMISTPLSSGSEKLLRRGRGNLLTPETKVSVCSYDPAKNTSIIRLLIHQGVRHQIRVHLATLGNPIMGDVLYGRWGEVLQLVSAGCSE
jgi:23S rRNA-/tRNA-specific pseudouridylate synthase